MCYNNNAKTRSLKRILSNNPHQPDNFQDNSLTPQQFHISSPSRGVDYEQLTSHRKHKIPQLSEGSDFTRWGL